MLFSKLMKQNLLPRLYGHKHSSHILVLWPTKQNNVAERQTESANVCKRAADGKRKKIGDVKDVDAVHGQKVGGISAGTWNGFCLH